jgi:prevent-host-death family protein
MARTAGVRQVKAQLSRFIELARSEGDVVITDRGKPVARLSAITRVDPKPVAELVAELAEDGLIDPAEHAPRALPPPVKTRRVVSVAKLIREARR